MPNRRLTAEELARAMEVLAEVRQRLDRLSAGDKDLLFAYWRKVSKELIYDERKKPSDRRKLKTIMWAAQDGKCAHCQKDLPLKRSELDRKEAAKGYVRENVELVHAHCHHERQEAKGYA
jgi:hypothetical protein